MFLCPRDFSVGKLYVCKHELLYNVGQVYTKTEAAYRLSSGEYTTKVLSANTPFMVAAITLEQPTPTAPKNRAYVQLIAPNGFGLTNVYEFGELYQEIKEEDQPNEPYVTPGAEP